VTGRKIKDWMVDVNFQHPDGRRVRIRKVSPVQTRRGAEQYERELRASLLAGTYGRKEEEPVPLFAEYVKQFTSDYVKCTNKPSEVQTKADIFRVHLLPAFGHLRLDEINARRIDGFTSAQYDKKYNPKTINNQLACLRRALVIAKRWGLLRDLPCITALKTADPEIDFFSFEEVERLLRNARAEDRAMVVVAVRTGMRLGELRGLRWGDLDLKAGRLVVRQSLTRQQFGTPKSGRSREIPLSTDTVKALQAHRHLRGELVFCREDGKPLGKDQCNEILWRCCRLAGVRKVGWHLLRHTFASHLAMRGVSLRAIQMLLGHSTVQMTERYAHLSPDVRRDAVELLDQPAPRQIDGRSSSEQAGS
jgi:integrase